MAKIDPPAPGTLLLGKYRVERAIGSGGMGVVVEATHLGLDQRVAIKLLASDLANTPEVVARFLREGRIAARLQSEHVVRVTDVAQGEGGVPYLVMELLVGHDFERVIAERQPMPVSDAVDYLLQACAGVAEAHAAGLVHRDLKPANLFLARRQKRAPIVKVLDFGLSKEPPGGAMASLTAMDSVFGTPQYMSPEQIHSSKHVDARSDQHALAMILFEMLAGAPPYRAENVAKLIVVIATQPPPAVRDYRPDVPPKLEAALLKALAKKPAERFADLAAFADALAPFGGPLAREAVAEVHAALARGVTTSALARSDAAITSPIGLGPRDALPSNTGLTSSVDPVKKRERRSKQILAAAIVGAVGVGVGLGAMITRRPGDRAAATPSSGEPLAPIATASAAATANPEPAPSVEPAPQASASASASAQATSKRPPRAAPPRSAKPAVSSAIGVFGDRKK